MKRSLILLCLLCSIFLHTDRCFSEFPERPIKIVVYTQPGGMIDITARKVAQILQDRYVKQPIVVENKKGAGGIVAIAHLLRQPADGHTMLGLTSSVISKLVSAKQEKKLNELYFLTRMVEDYECLITHSGAEVVSAKDIIKDAKKRPGKQVWVGPATGGTDHLFALKFWDAANMDARWVPYRSGGEAIAALLGKHGVVYVGNPQDVAGRAELRVAAVASPERLSEHPDTPTFRELGFDQLTHENLWRGFAIRKGTEPKTVQSLETLLEKVAQDKEWKEFLEQGGVTPVFDKNKAFSKVVAAQIEKDKTYLSSSKS